MPRTQSYQEGQPTITVEYSACGMSGKWNRSIRPTSRSRLASRKLR